MQAARRLGEAKVEGACPSGLVLLQATVATALLLPFFALTSSAWGLLMLTASLGGAAVATMLVAKTSAVSSPASRRFHDRVETALAAAAGAAFAVVAARLYPSAQNTGRLVLLADMMSLPASALVVWAGRPARWAFALPCVAGGTYAVLAAGGPSAPVLAILQLGMCALGLATRGTVPSRDEAPARPCEARDELVDLLLAGKAASADEWLWASDLQFRLVGELDRFAEASGVARGTLEGRALMKLFAEDDGHAAIRAAFEARAAFRDVIVRLAPDGGEDRWWRIGGQPMIDGEGRFAGYRGLVADVSALRRAQARIAHLATHDALTGLANRESFQRAAEKAGAAARADAPLAILVLDLDGFKQVNDDLGHAVGDELLAAVAAMLGRIAPADALVARLGGDEFAILVPGAGVASAERLAAALIKAVSVPFTLGEHRAAIGVSIGLAVAPEHALAARELARKADLALLRAKGAGRGSLVAFVAAFEEEEAERLRLQADIALALERGEFTLHYQPLLDIAAARIDACEALIRWTSPTRGSVAPAAFIPAAESGALILAIGRFVLERACRDAAAWPLPVTVAVNISPQHLRSPEFRADVMAALKASGLPPSRLEIEITEGVFLDRSSASMEALTWLRERGLKVALDDFGTGFSSLNYLVDFPVDKIKIDRSFIVGLTANRQSRAVVDAILMLARELGLRVVAEGVETVAQALALKLRRCDDLQGYLISRPRPAEEIGRLLVELPASVRDTVPALLESSFAAALVLKATA